MTKKIIKNVELDCSWTTYLGSVGGILKNAGLWHDEIYKLAGLTGIAFHFIMHETLCPSGPTVYDWSIEHFTMMDRIGIHSKQLNVFNNQLNTIELIKRDAIEIIKKSLDDGKAVVVWAPTILEFGIIKRYDDEEKVFFIADCTNADADPMLFDNLGVSDAPWLYIQTFHEKIEVDMEKMIRNSLNFGVSQWNKEFHMPGYASGEKAYEYTVKALESNNFNRFGFSYCLSLYSDSKSQIAEYMKFVSEISREITGLKKCCELFSEVAQKYTEMTELIPFMMPGNPNIIFNEKNVPKVVSLLKECCELETKAMKEIEKALK